MGQTGCGGIISAQMVYHASSKIIQKKIQKIQKV